MPISTAFVGGAMRRLHLDRSSGQSRDEVAEAAEPARGERGIVLMRRRLAIVRRDVERRL